MGDRTNHDNSAAVVFRNAIGMESRKTPTGTHEPRRPQRRTSGEMGTWSRPARSA